MNRAHDFSEKVIAIGAVAAFAGQADFRGKVLQDIEGDMANHNHVLGGMVFANAAMILPERHVQAPMQGIFNAPIHAQPKLGQDHRDLEGQHGKAHVC